jgi:transcriptional regulator with XRE-family HTH domain
LKEKSTLRKFGDIIERIEYIRKYLNLNKSRFSAGIGMKPQTYNNFIGSQGSKPNIELIHGIVNRFKVNPHWLLNGTGEVFSDQEGVTGESIGWEGEVREEDPVSRQHRESVGHLQQQLKDLQPVIKEIETRIKGLENTQVPLVNGLTKALGAYVELDPVGATREIKGFILRLEQRLSKIK